MPKSKKLYKNLELDSYTFIKKKKKTITRDRTRFIYNY